jgi:hypothetical protein
VTDATSSVIYCDNGPNSEQYGEVFTDVVRAIGLRPIVYRGVGAASRRSTLDRELRDDFYQGALAVVRLAGEEPLDNWAVAEFSHCQSIGKFLLVYLDGLSTQARSNITPHVTIPVSEINGVDDFRRVLPRDVRLRLNLP